MTQGPVAAARLRQEAVAIAGGVGDLQQRASAYHHLFAHSGGNHCFPLLAAHGALWASGYFRRGMRFGRLVAGARGLIGGDRGALMASLARFADDFRDINRRVCVETYFIYRLTGTPALREEAVALVPPTLLEAMDRCHAARTAGRRMTAAERRALFEAFFLWEQAVIVGPAVLAAFDAFDWGLIKRLALRPTIDFAYFDCPPLHFRHFADADERIAMGLRAFDRAEQVGWTAVEAALARYRLMPAAWPASPTDFFERLAAPVLSPA